MYLCVVIIYLKNNPRERRNWEGGGREGDVDEAAKIFPAQKLWCEKRADHVGSTSWHRRHIFSAEFGWAGGLDEEAAEPTQVDWWVAKEANESKDSLQRWHILASLEAVAALFWAILRSTRSASSLSCSAFSLAAVASSRVLNCTNWKPSQGPALKWVDSIFSPHNQHHWQEQRQVLLLLLLLLLLLIIIINYYY